MMNIARGSIAKYCKKSFNKKFAVASQTRKYAEKVPVKHDDNHDYHPYNDGSKNNLEKYIDGPFPDSEEVAVGIERYELDILKEGKSPFNLGPAHVTGPHFGTVADPVIVNTFFDERIVGCQGEHTNKIT